MPSATFSSSGVAIAVPRLLYPSGRIRSAGAELVLSPAAAAAVTAAAAETVEGEVALPYDRWRGYPSTYPPALAMAMEHKVRSVGQWRETLLSCFLTARPRLSLSLFALRIYIPAGVASVLRAGDAASSEDGAGRGRVRPEHGM